MIERVHVNRVEALANAEQENADDDEGEIKARLLNLFDQIK
jgi:hypothetical protein